MSLPIELQTKILRYNIHPIAEIIKYYLNFIGRKWTHQSYRPSMFARYDYSDSESDHERLI
jgi:hypothetical protein